MTILFVTEIMPFPVHGGERLRSYGLLKILSKTFSKVIAVIGKTHEACYQNYDFENVEFHEFDFESERSTNKYINCIKIFNRNRKLLKILDEILSNNRIDVTFIDYLYNGQYIKYFKTKRIPVIYGTHNVQSRISFQRPAASLRNRISIAIESLAFYIHEKMYFRKADAIVAVSENDSLYYKKYMPRENVFVIPNFLIEEDYKLNHVDKENYVVMSANFHAFQNLKGLQWFIEQVWIDNHFNDRLLYLVGIGSDTVLNRLFGERTFKNIKVLGSVDDLKPHIARAKVSVVPLLHGSGTRLKCIESMALKTQLLSTSKGAEGIEHEGSIAIADDTVAFIHLLDEILLGKIDNTEKAYSLFLEKYSSQPNKATLKNIVQHICS